MLATATASHPPDAVRDQLVNIVESSAAEETDVSLGGVVETKNGAKMRAIIRLLAQLCGCTDSALMIKVLCLLDV